MLGQQDTAHPPIEAHVQSTRVQEIPLFVTAPMSSPRGGSPSCRISGSWSCSSSPCCWSASSPHSPWFSWRSGSGSPAAFSTVWGSKVGCLAAKRPTRSSLPVPCSGVLADGLVDGLGTVVGVSCESPSTIQLSLPQQHTYRCLSWSQNQVFPQ